MRASGKLLSCHSNLFDLLMVKTYCSHILRGITLPVVENKKYFLIVFTGRQNRNKMEYDIGHIFHDFWMASITNVYVVASAQNGEDVIAKLYTFFPYNEKRCGDVRPVIVNEYREDGMVSELNVFVNKYRNMHRCPIKLLLPREAPWLWLFVDTDQNGMKRLYGPEASILTYLVKAMNFQFSFEHVWTYDVPRLV